MKTYLEKNFDFRKLLKSFLVIYLFFHRAIFNLIPMTLFGLNLTNPSDKMICYLNLYMGLAFGLVVFFVYYKDLSEELKNFIRNIKKHLDTGLKYWFLGLIIMYISNIILLLVFKSGGANNENAVQEMIKLCPIAMGFYSCLIAPVAEEIVFRKTLKDFFKNKWFFAIASFLFFGGAHVISMANNIIDLLYIIPYGALGATFALAYYETDSIYTTITFHIIHNSLLFFLSILI